jgi:hypothetical protein
MSILGHCACQKVRYEVTASPLIVHACHCRNCQRETGSAFAINALIETTNTVQLQGETEEVLTPTASEKGQRVVRCSECKVAVWSHYAYGKLSEAIVFLRVGTLVEPDLMPPNLHIYTESKQAWLTLPTGIPSFPHYYKASEQWTKESLKRRDVLFAALT